MTRQTSIETYHNIRNSGLLTKLRFLTYEFLFRNGPLTQSECFTGMTDAGLFNKSNGHQSIAPRFAELKRLGCIIEVEKRPCIITGRNCIAWDVTSNLPTDPVDRPSSKQIIDALKKRIIELNIELAKYKQAPAQAYLFADMEL